MRVLQSVREPSDFTRFVNQVVNDAPDDIDHLYFSWKTLALGRFDVFHIHWPEALLRDKKLAFRVAKRLILLVSLIRMRMFGGVVLRTIHNIKPHEESSPLERLILRQIDKMTSASVVLNRNTPTSADKPSYYIPHGHYIDRFRTYPRSQLVRGRILAFGLIRPYKGTEQLIESFSKVVTPGITLRIVGKPSSSSLRDSILNLCSVDERIQCRLEYVSDAELVREFSEAELVVLPYHEIHNSGVLLVALSLQKPVLVRSNEVTEAMSVEVGSGWLQFFSGELTADDIQKALTSLRERSPLTSPRLTGRDWRSIAENYAAVYRDLVSRELKPTNGADAK